MSQSPPPFPELLRQIRSELGISQEDLSRKLGVSFATVNRWEAGKTSPSRLARAQFDGFCRRMVEAGKLKREFLVQ
jgi:transcriptional regulator with XRE-family HTH domain